MIIDAHSHLFDPKFDADREAVIERMQAAGVSTITVGTSYDESVKAIEIAEQLGMWATVGQHPTDTFEEFDSANWRRKFLELAKNPRVVAIGECGFDYVQSKFSKLPLEEEKVRQRKLFEAHITLAKDIHRPLMIHCREAYNDLMPMIPSDVRAHIHFFSGDWSIAKECLDRGWTLSFPGTITFPLKAGETWVENLLDVVRRVPADRYTIETDAPCVAPAAYRGKRNEPAYVLQVAGKVAELRGEPLEKVIEDSTATARRIFAL